MTKATTGKKGESFGRSVISPVTLLAPIHEENLNWRLLTDVSEHHVSTCSMPNCSYFLCNRECEKGTKKKQTETIKQKLWFCGRYMQENLSTVTSWGLCWFPGNFMITTRLRDVITPPNKVAVVKNKTQLVFFTLQFFYRKTRYNLFLSEDFFTFRQSHASFFPFFPPSFMLS